MSSSAENNPLRHTDSRPKAVDSTTGVAKQALSPLDTQGDRRGTLPDSAVGPSPNTPAGRPSTTPLETHAELPSVAITDAGNNTRSAELADLSQGPNRSTAQALIPEPEHLIPRAPVLPSSFDFTFNAGPSSSAAGGAAAGEDRKGKGRLSDPDTSGTIVEAPPSFAQAHADTLTYRGVLDETGMHAAPKIGDPAPEGLNPRDLTQLTSQDSNPACVGTEKVALRKGSKLTVRLDTMSNNLDLADAVVVFYRFMAAQHRKA